MRFRFSAHRSSQAHFPFWCYRLLYNFDFAEQPVCFDTENAQVQRLRLVVFSKRLQTNISFTTRRTNRNILSICHNGIPVRPQRIVKNFERFYIFICEYAVYIFAQHFTPVRFSFFLCLPSCIRHTAAYRLNERQTILSAKCIRNRPYLPIVFLFP